MVEYMLARVQQRSLGMFVLRCRPMLSWVLLSHASFNSVFDFSFFRPRRGFFGVSEKVFLPGQKTRKQVITSVYTSVLLFFGNLSFREQTCRKLDIPPTEKDWALVGLSLLSVDSWDPICNADQQTWQVFCRGDAHWSHKWTLFFTQVKTDDFRAGNFFTNFSCNLWKTRGGSQT